METIKTHLTLIDDITGRKAANFAHSIAAKPYNIWILKGNRMINAKSILGLLSLNIQKDDEIEIQISCNDEAELLYICKEINN